jgi:hypothetical protein
LVATFWVSQSHCNVSDKCFCTVSICCVIYPRQMITHLILLAFLKYLPSLSLAELRCMYSLNAKSENVKGVWVIRGLPLKVSLCYYWGNNRCFKGWSGIAGYVPEYWQQNALIKGILGLWTPPLHPSALFSPESNMRHDQSGFESQEFFQPNLCPPRIEGSFLLSYGPPRDLQPRRETC